MSLPPACAAACPLGPATSSLFDFPVGQVRRVAPANEEVDETKRNILKLAAVAGVLGIGAGGAVGGALQFVQPPSIGLSSYPKVALVDTDGSPLTARKVDSATKFTVDTSELYLFNYPLRNEPNFLLNLYPGASSVPRGIGAHGSIVAYSAICQHLGCPAPALAYYPPGTCPRTFSTARYPSLSFYIHCSCHGSTYDVTNSAANLTGPAVLPLPQVILETDVSDPTGQIYATSVDGPPVNGHLNTLQGDYGVGSTSQLVSESPVILCSFPS